MLVARKAGNFAANLIDKILRRAGDQQNPVGRERVYHFINQVGIVFVVLKRVQSKDEGELVLCIEFFCCLRVFN